MTTGRHSWKSRAPPVSTLERWPKVSAKSSECGCANDSSAIGPTVRSCWPLVRGPCEGSPLDVLHRCAIHAPVEEFTDQVRTDAHLTRRKVASVPGCRYAARSASGRFRVRG